MLLAGVSGPMRYVVVLASLGPTWSLCSECELGGGDASWGERQSWLSREFRKWAHGHNIWLVWATESGWPPQKFSTQPLVAFSSVHLQLRFPKPS